MDKPTDTFIRTFEGRGDVATWLKKLELVAKIKKIKNIACLIPLYLEGDAFAVFDQLTDADKEDSEAIKKALRDAFGQNKFSAYDSFRLRSWTPVETVDAFLADLRRLARLAGIHSDELIRCAFVCGLPADVSSRLRAGARILEEDVSSILTQARVLMDERAQTALAAVRLEEVPRSTSRAAGVSRKLSCFQCGGDHPVRYCKKRPSIVCWICEEPGHIARNCPSKSRQSGNGSGKPPAPAAFPAK
jgi:RNase H-fold protein (predicted Holliday junction resolvase)